ncbi:UNVERIFIED_CONTAM: hypothetical protein FKN15_041776 [Acipenser sinensis]
MIVGASKKCNSLSPMAALTNVSIKAVSQDVQKHSVHTLVFRSLKRTHDMFVADHAKAVAIDEESHKLKMAAKIRADYSAVLHMPVLKEGKEKILHQTGDQYGQCFSANPGIALTADTQMQKMPSDTGVQSMALALPLSQARQDASRTAASMADIHRHAGSAERSQPPGHALSYLEAGGTKNSSLMAKKAPTMPKPQWHPPWKLYRVISGHLGWVRSIAVEPGNQWFVTGSGDRTIKIWDLASGKLKLSLTGHISTVRGVAISSRSPYLFSCGEDKQVKCWDLEYNKVIRHYHGHLSAVYGIDLHPTIDVLVTCSRDSTARTPLSRVTLKVSLVAKEQFANSFSLADNGTIHMWDWRTGYNFQRIHAAVQPGSLDSESGIFACMFDHSESRLITAEADKTIKVYREDDTACDKERMNPNQQSPSRPVRALYNRNCGLRTEWLGSSFRGQSEAGHSGRGRRYGTWSHRPSTRADRKPDLNAHEHQHSEHRTCTRAHSPETWAPAITCTPEHYRPLCHTWCQYGRYGRCHAHCAVTSAGTETGDGGEAKRGEIHGADREGRARERTPGTSGTRDGAP